MRSIFRFFYNRFKIPLFLLFFLTSSTILAQTDFLGIPSITLNGQKYNLKWSAKPRQTRIIQEYLLSGEPVRRYDTKLILEYFRTGKTAGQIADEKLINLTDEKEEGRVLDFKRLDSSNPDEAVIEFTVGNTQDGVTRNVEWNVCRYKSNPGGVVLLTMSKRAYEENNVNAFFQKVNENRLNWIETVVNYQLPEITAK
jgi:hypothetical protein